MNHDFLSFDKLRPFWFRYVGLTLAFCTLAIGIYLKTSDVSKLLGLKQDLLKPIFLLCLLFIINAKSKTEDERTTQIRLQINQFGYNFIVGIVALIFLANATSGNPVTVELINLIISIVTTQVLIYEAIKSPKIMDFFEKHQNIFQLLALFLIGFLVKINLWFW